MSVKEMASFRLDAELVTELRKHAEERGESLSDVLRRAALLFLGYCPTCQRKVEAENDAIADGATVAPGLTRVPASGSP